MYILIFYEYFYTTNPGMYSYVNFFYYSLQN